MREGVPSRPPPVSAIANTFHPTLHVHQLGDLFNGKFETDTFLDFGACAAGAMFAHHFGSMNFGGNDAHVTAFMGTFLLFSGFNAAKNNLDRALALAVASTCYTGTMNPAVSFANTMNNGFNNLSSGLFITIFFQVAGAFAAGKVKAFADAKA